jgi:hypothetical protein
VPTVTGAIVCTNTSPGNNGVQIIPKFKRFSDPTGIGCQGKL